ncbi:discoidin domain-containing protein, partial [Clostridium sp.]|uniref:discoidin domain-containing protein n=1 Tax=Clostridium sp. TaxID=1506 RepID=UPI003F3CC792
NVTSSAPKTGKGTATITVEPIVGEYEGMITERTTEFVVNVSEKPSELSAKVGENNVALTEASSLEEFNAGTNMYFYDQAPNLNKYSTEGSEFANVEITTTPKVYVKVDKTNVKENAVQLTIKDFTNTQDLAKNEVNENLSVPGNFNAPEDLLTATQVGLQWDNVEGATSYDVEIDGTIYKNILENSFTDVNVEYDTVYNYRVRAVNNDGHSEWSEVISPKTALDPYRNVPKDMQVIWNEGHYSNEVPENAVDGDPNSQFHSAGNVIDKPVVFDMQKSYTLEKLELLFRKNGNGSVKRAEIYSSLDGVHYEKLFSNAKDSGNEAWATDGEAKTINFDKPIKARYFKIVVKEAVGNFMAMREFRPYKVDGTNGQIVGDWNNSGKIEEGDLTFLQNYAGLSTVDSDWNYVSMADLNGNGLIDAYDIAYVTSKLEDGAVPTQDKLAGELMLVPSKTEIKAGETFTVDVVGTGLSDVNAFSVEIPLDASKYELIGTPENAEATTSMKNLSKSRVHGDGNQAIYAVFSNIGESTKVSGTTTVSTITLKAKADVNFDMLLTNAILVDSRTMPKNAIANVVSPDSELPTPKPTTNKIVKENITVSGDESQLQTGMGLNKLIDGTTSSDDSSRMDLKWIFSPDQEDKGSLPFEMIFEFNEPKKMDNFTIYHRANGQEIHGSSMKKVKAVGYLNGVATELGEVSDINTITTTYDLNNQVFDKIVITALEGRTDNHTLAVNEIEFYEQLGEEITGIEFVDAPSHLDVNKVTPVFANVTPDKATNDYYRISSEDSSIVDVIRLDDGTDVKYYLRGLKDGKTNIVATTADGNFTAKYEVTVGNGGEVEEIVVSKPVNLRATEITNNSATLTWDIPTSVIGLDEYVIYKDGKEVATVKAGTTEYKEEGLKANTIYGYKVTAKYSNGEESKPVSVNIRTKK